MEIKNKTDYCPCCNGKKMVLIRENKAIAGTVYCEDYICDIEDWKKFHDSVEPDRVWCSDCGLLYHSASIA